MARPSSDAASPEAPVASKRRASARLSAAEPEVKRIKSNADLSLRQAKSTTSKSKYFEAEDSEEESESNESEDESSESVYEEGQGEASSTDEAEPEEPSDSEEDTKKSSARGQQRASTASKPSALKGKELWREGVKADLAPGQEIVIAKPKARDAGKTPYQDETLHPNTRLFLIDLADNNDRQWMKGVSCVAASEWLADSCSARSGLPRGKEGFRDVCRRPHPKDHGGRHYGP